MSKSPFRFLTTLAFVFALAAPAAAATITVDGRFDPNEGYTQTFSLPFYAEDGKTYYGTMYQYVGEDSVYQAWVLPLEVNDTSYGSTSLQDPFNWPGGKGRTFGQIVGSDMAQLTYLDSMGKVILDAFVDNLAKYEMKDGSAEYRSAGVTTTSDDPNVSKVRQSDGSVATGSALSFINVATSFQYNYNLGPDAAKGNLNPNSPTGLTGWIDQVIYEVEIDRLALGTDFVSVMKLAHMSPEKIGLKSIGPPTETTPPGGGNVPEPGTMLLMGSALAGLAWRRSRRRRSAKTA